MTQGTDFVYARARMQAYEQSEPFLRARVEALPETEDRSAEAQALARDLLARFQQFVERSERLGSEVLLNAAQIEEPGRLADGITPFLGLPVAAEQQILEALSPRERLARLEALMP